MRKIILLAFVAAVIWSPVATGHEIEEIVPVQRDAGVKVGVPPRSWVHVGNEMQAAHVKESNKEIIYLTAGKSIDTHFHYHGGTWGTINGDTYLFFSSSRERPVEAGQTVKGERQIMAANVRTGDLYYLTTIPMEGKGYDDHLNSRIYCATYNDAAKTIFFTNKNKTKIYAYDCRTGEQRALLDVPPGGAYFELYSHVDDQSIRLVYNYSMPHGSGSSQSASLVYFLEIADFDRDWRLRTSRIIRKTAPGEAVNHPEINPRNKDLLFYQHKSMMRENGVHAKIDFYLHNLADGKERLIPTGGRRVDHQVWGASGDYIYWDVNRYSDTLFAYEWRTDSLQVTAKGFYSGHNKLSHDESLWVYDVMSYGSSGNVALYEGKNQYGRAYSNWMGSIWIYNRNTARRELYATILWGHPHPRHPHAVFSPDDSMISFVTAADVESANTRVAVMRVE